MKNNYNNKTKNNSRTKVKLRLMATLAMLALAPALWAQIPDYPGEDYVRTLNEWNGEGSGEFKITSNKTAGSIKVVNELKLYPVDGNYTITKTSTGHNNIFWTGDGSKLYIIGNASNTLNIYGNCGNGTVENQTPIPTQTNYSGAGVLLLGNAKCYLKHVVFYGFVTHVDWNGQKTNQGGIVTMGNNSSGGECHMDHVTFRHSYGGPVNPQNGNNYGRIISFVNGVWDVTMDNVTIRDCLVSEKLDGHNFTDVKIEGMGSIIRSQGQVGGSLTMTNCEAYNNTYRDLSLKNSITSYTMAEVMLQPLSGQGGVINWRSGRLSPTGGTQVTLVDCKFHHNSARQGGAIATCATITMSGTEIYNNEAEQGGGVFFYTYRGQDNPYDGRGFEATFGNEVGNEVKVYRNVAKYYGGGICINIDASDDVGFDADGNARDADFTVEIQSKSKVYENKAPKGAGVAIRDSAPYKHLNCKKKLLGGDPNPAYLQWSGEYRREVKINGGSVYNNTTDVTTTDDEMAGAGIFIEKYPTTFEFTYSDDGPTPVAVAYSQDYNYQDEPGTYGSGTLTVNAESGLIYGNIATNGIKRGYGGGMYIASKFTTDDDNNSIKSTLNVNIGKTGENLEMYNNQAYTDGGGVYVWYDRTNGRKNEGTVTVAGGTIGKTDLATGNKALHGNGGGICVMSGTVVVENGHVDYNTANQNGGGIYLNDGNLTFTGGNVDQNEASNSNGGGICVMGGTVEVDGGHVDHNTANQKGGGIYLNDGNLTFTGGNVDQNEASNSDGGGICVEGGNIVVSGGTVSNNEAKLKNGGGICVLGGTVLVEGGNILTNTANELGGGVYVSVQDATIITKIRGGANISSNSAKGGGGVYVDKGILKLEGLGFDSDAYGQTEAEADNTHTRITKNTASDGNGGGINAGNGEVDLTNTLIYKNTASGTVSKGRGGGVYLDGGIINIVSSKILHNTAETNGGGIDDHSGDIEIYGGDISYNTAINGRGGGIYTNAGDIRIWPSALYNPDQTPTLDQCKNTGTVFSYNKAGTNGGGLNTHIGRLEVRYAKVHHNVAGHNYTTIGTQGGSGGGMFCEGPHADLSGYTVRLLHTLLNYNKAYGNGGSDDNLTGRGGGLYLKYGSIFAEHCNILGNKADINGGGLDNHDGELRVYGSIIGKSLEETMPEDCKTEDDDENGNRAIRGRGGGIYTDKGNLVVGPCDSYGFVESKASRICNNTAHINGGGINNHEGDITIHGDRINNNTAVTGDGGGVYINSGQIYMYGGQINNNKADNGKGGGVYGGGGTFNIMEREAHPILEILDVEDITTSGFTIHFHHVDRGNAMKPTASNKEYGIAFSVNPYPSDLGENVEWTVGTGTNTDWTGVTKVSFNPTSTQPTPPAHHSYNQNEGCSRFVVNNSTTPNGITINSNTTYYVVAYGKYTYGGKNYFDASPVVAVKTHGDLPVVVTGVGFDITSTSASVNGKLFYGGSSDVTEKGIEIYNGSNWTAQPSSSVGNVFSVTFNDLTPNTEYKARAYAKNNGGNSIGYGDEITFTTVASGKAMEDVGNTPRSIYPSVEENPFFRELTPLQQAIMASTFEGDSTVVRHQKSRDDDEPIDIPQINNNTATYGGGICIDKKGANLIFSGNRGEVDDDDPIGQINYNYASEAGGGIYIGRESADKYAQMQMMGKCEVNFNRVPSDKYGGGIYLDGRLYVGDKYTDADGVHGFKVDKNFAITKSQSDFADEISAILDEIAAPAVVEEYGDALNNVFLVRNQYDYYVNENHGPEGDNRVSVITLLSDISGFNDLNNNGMMDGTEQPYSHIGFSVVNGFCPVITTASVFGGDYNTVQTTGESPNNPNPYENWLYSLMTLSNGSSGTAENLTGAVFEDSESYVAVHTRSNMAPFLGKFIYLWGCWTHPIVMNDPETNNPMAGEGDGGDWLHHYRILNPEDNTDDGTGDPLKWEIYTPEGLAWFTSYVNGLNAFDEKEGGDGNGHHKWNKDKNPKAIAKLMNDLDMSAYLWVPIGSVQKFYKTALNSETESSLFVDADTDVITGGSPDGDYSTGEHHFRGTFDGQGHVIKGLQGLYLTGIKKFGLFGYLDEGAVVKNVFVDDGLFVSDDDAVVYSSGGIAGEMKEGTLSNSEARMSFNTTHSHADTKVGGLVGELAGGNIHSCMTMPSLTGSNRYLGGLAGQVGTTASIKNSFSNSEIELTGDIPPTERHIGGIAGENNGTIANCYVRYQGTTPPEGFGWFAGKNNYTAAGETTPEAIGTIRYCYAPRVADDESYDYADFNYIANPIENSVLELQANYGATKLESGKYGFKHRDQQMTENADNRYIVNDVFLGGLLPTLNNWVETTNASSSTIYTTWTRTMASPINDDYPILQISEFKSVGSRDGIYMEYEDDINDMWTGDSGKHFDLLTSADNPKAAMYLYDVNPTPVGISNNEAARLYIHEDVGIMQDANAALHARVGVTIKDGGDWHLFSSAISGVPMGLEYNAGGPVNGGAAVSEGFYNNRLEMDPKEKTSWSETAIGYFPTNTPYGTWRGTSSFNAQGVEGFFDLYDYSEHFYHWINYKRASDDHWHMDTNKYGLHQKFDTYPNDRYMVAGKGYLMALSEASMMMADGVLNNTSDIEQTITLSGLKCNLPEGLEGAAKSGGYTYIWRGINLLGNPYQSYLDFNAFANAIPSAKGKGLSVYAIVDESQPGDKHYVYYTKTQSRNEPYSAGPYIHPHQGFFVKMEGEPDKETDVTPQTVTFKNAMRMPGTSASMNSYFRGHVDYPLVNLLCYDEDGERDLTTVEVNRPEFGGGEKMDNLHKSKGMIYAQMEGESFQVLFAPVGTTTVPVRFEAKEDGVFTLNWNTRHGEFSYLHLVDNITGVDVDCLTANEYKFEGKTSDYRSRFKLVFRCEGDEPEDPEDPDTPEDEDTDHFAFIFGNELVVNGEGILQMFDIQGRCLMETQAFGSQSNHNLPRVSAGVYLLRLTSDKKVRVQKMVIK